MNVYDYRRLIREGKLDKIAEEWNIIDFTRYKHLGKYILEYLLEKNIHTNRMDSLAKNDKKWFKYYLKYNITKPLLSTSLELLLNVNDNELLLETLLKKLNKRDKEKLYRNLKCNNYFLFHNFESYLNSIFKKYGVDKPNIFIELPLIYNDKVKSYDELDIILDEFKKVFKDTHELVLNTFINEFKRKAKINKKQTYNDIKRLIKVKKDKPSFELVTPEYNLNVNPFDGEYKYLDHLQVNLYGRGIMNHEISHFIFNDNDDDEDEDLFGLYRILRQNTRKKDTITKMINYIKDFHNRYKYMKNMFKELYYKEIERKYGNINNYRLVILNDLRKYKPIFITFDIVFATIIVDKKRKINAVDYIIENELKKYQKVMTYNYYTEELMLENLLDALLNGAIWEGKYNVRCLSGHSKSYFKDNKVLSLEEVIADFYAIKNSPKANILINKLRDIVGDELVDFLESYTKKIYEQEEEEKSSISSYIEICDEMDGKRYRR